MREYDIYGGSLSVTRVDHNQPTIKFKGERHSILSTKSGFKSASYCGPGTQAAERLRLNVKPLTESDKICQAHDLRYSLAKNLDDIRDADNKMIRKMKQIKKKKKDNKFNTATVGTAMKAKVFLEDKGVLSKTKFAGFLADNPKEGSKDYKIIRDTLEDIEQQGYGKKKKKSEPKPPAYDLKIKLMKQYKK